MKKYEALEAAIATLEIMKKITPNNYEHFTDIIKGLKELRQQEPEITTLNKIIEKERGKDPSRSSK